MQMSKNDLKSIRSKISDFGKNIIYKIIHDISMQLFHLHSFGIVHLDIKPGNILLGSNGNFYLCDFSHSRIITDRDHMKCIEEGDSRYLAKEVLENFLFYNSKNNFESLKKADIFSFGITILILLMESSVELPKNG